MRQSIKNLEHINHFKAQKRIKEQSGWGTWTGDQAKNMIDKDVKTIDDAKGVLKDMAEMIIHLRDRR